MKLFQLMERIGILRIIQTNKHMVIPEYTDKYSQQTSAMPLKPWSERPRPNRLEGRYEFPDYATLRDFLDRAAELSERTGLYPDLGFETNYVNVTIHAAEDDGEIGRAQREYAEAMDALAEPER